MFIYVDGLLQKLPINLLSYTFFQTSTHEYPIKTYYFKRRNAHINIKQMCILRGEMLT